MISPPLRFVGPSPCAAKPLWQKAAPRMAGTHAPSPVIRLRRRLRDLEQALVYPRSCSAEAAELRVPLADVPGLVAAWAGEARAAGAGDVRREVVWLARQLLDHGVLHADVIGGLLDVAQEVGGGGSLEDPQEEDALATGNMWGAGCVGLYRAVRRRLWDGTEGETKAAGGGAGPNVHTWSGIADRLRVRQILRRHLERCGRTGAPLRLELRHDPHFVMVLLGLRPGPLDKDPVPGTEQDSVWLAGTIGPEVCAALAALPMGDGSVRPRVVERRGGAEEAAEGAGPAVFCALLTAAMPAGSPMMVLGSPDAIRHCTVRGAVVPCVRHLWAHPQRGAMFLDRSRAYLSEFIAALHACHPTALDADFRRQVVYESTYAPPLLRCGMMDGWTRHPTLAREVDTNARCFGASLAQIRAASLVWFSEMQGTAHCPSPFGLGQSGGCRRPSGSASFQAAGELDEGADLWEEERSARRRVLEWALLRDAFRHKFALRRQEGTHRSRLGSLPVRAARMILEYGWSELEYCLMLR
jgi:hypothetical protein